MTPIKLYNTASKKNEELIPLNPPKVGLYTCGPTVYYYPQIGNWRTFVFYDLLRRILEYDGYEVNHIMNLTDVGHLTGDNVGDADLGEDRMEKAARREGKNIWDIASFYINDFRETGIWLNLLPPTRLVRATDHLPEQIALIQRLETKGLIYQTRLGVYFNTANFPDYGKLGGQKLKDKRTATSEELVEDPEKKSSFDFALWKLSKPEDRRQMEWDSPWGKGFPGWHIECSAMSMKYLGETIDIHTGGIDHVAIHHTNEIAQSEGATGKSFARFWLHGEFLTVDGGRMGKSLGNAYTLHDIKTKGIDPLALRYFYLTAHYRSKQNFTWEALQNAQNSLNELRGKIVSWRTKKSEPIDETKIKQAETRFREIICDDINIPRALAFAWEITKDKQFSEKEKEYLITDSFDKIFGLRLKETNENPTIPISDLPKNIKELIIQRESARTDKDFENSDKLRKELETLGYNVTDSPDGQQVRQF